MNSILEGFGMTSIRTRERMVARLRKQGIVDERVLGAMSTVPRHLFIGQALAHRAYEDTALPLILGQTISQPYIVARMIEILLDGRDNLGKTLEVGAGCGYQAAVLARLAKQVIAIERLAPLLTLARENLRQARVSTVRLKHADGILGLADAAPFDTIIVAAAAQDTPQALLDQLNDQGRLLLPSHLYGKGDNEVQVLRLYRRTGKNWQQHDFEAVRFVPLVAGVI